jgi:serine/threonine protein kinase
MAEPPATEPLNACVHCGTAFPLGARFCPSCGRPAELSARHLPPPVRRHSTAITTADPLIGQVVAERYRILEQLGRGGMGVVYRVEHVHIGKLMAMKLLSGELAHEANTLKRFEREAKVISKLTHPNTVQIFDFGESGRLVYLVMEYLPGRSLSSLISSEHALPFARVAQIGAQIAASVEEAHERGVIHRDIKPENVMILDTSEQQDFVKVLDFGIAKLRDFVDDGPATQKGHLIGTPHYMAPEQIRGEAFDHRVDIYALGALMYQAVTGEVPFSGDSPMEVLGKHLNDELIPVRRRAPERRIPEEAERIISKAMAKDPARRFQSMSALRDELLRFLRTLGLHSDSFAIEPEQVLGLDSAEQVATRGDVDGYERGMLRVNRLGKVLGLLALLGVAYAVYGLFRVDTRSAAKDVEVEPNDEPLAANLLSPTLPLSGLLGQRRSATEGDADVYRIELADLTTRVADIAVTALPNINLALDLVEKGSSTPVLTVDSGGLGEPERIPNLTLRGDTYYLRVRQVLPPGQLPVENVSDRYTVSLALSAQSESREHELNDTHELADVLLKSKPLTGRIGWARDKDVYCGKPSSAAQTVVVSAVPGLNLVLTFLERKSEAGQRVDHHGSGEGEQILLPAASHARESCFTVSVAEQPGEPRADPEHDYTITLDP